MPTISNLSSLTSITGTLIFPVVDLTSPIPNKKATLQQLKSWIEGNATVASVAGRIGDIVLTYQDIGGLSTVANTGNYSDLQGKPATFAIATATSSVLGGVRIGKNINVTATGTISLNTATASDIGLVKIGTGINVTTDGTISTTPISSTTVAAGLVVNSGILSVSTASTSTFGGVIIGNGLTANASGSVSVNTATTTTSGTVIVGDGLYLNNVATVNLITASSTVLGGIKAGIGIAITADGVMTVTTGTFALQTATSVSLGGVKIGDNIDITQDGTISVPGFFTNTGIIFNVSQTTGTFIQGGTGTQYQVGGIAIRRGTNSVASFRYTDNYYINTSTNTGTQGIWIIGHADNTSTFGTNGLMVDSIRVSSTATELNIFGYNNSNTAVISVRGTTNYENRVTQDFHIPNKKYVDVRSTSTATAVSVGVVKLGFGITAFGDGTINIGTATAANYGLIKVGTGLAINNNSVSLAQTGLLSVTTGTTSTIGGVKLGWPNANGLFIDNSANTSTGIISILTATTTTIGGVKIGTGVAVNAGGFISLSAATTSTLGGIIVGSNMAIDVGNALTFAGGTVPNSVYFSNSTTATSTTTGTLVVQGGIGIGGQVFIGGDTRIAGITTVTNTTSATSTTTGALQVVGGVGIGGDLFISGNITANKLTIQFTTVTTTLVQTDDIISTYNTTQSTGTTSGALIVGGGVGVGRDLQVGGNLFTTGTIYQGQWAVVTATFNTSTLIASAVSATQIQTTAQTASAVYYPTFVDTNNASAANEFLYTTSSFAINPNNGNVSIAGITTVTNTTAATSTTTGALRVVGGVGIGGQVFIGGNSSIAGITTVTNTTSATSTNTGALQVHGGVGIGGNLEVGGTGTQLGNFYSQFSVVPVNFSNTPVYTTSTTISDSRAQVGAIVIVTPSATTGTNILGGDELEMDNFTVAASVTTNGIINLYVTALPGPVKGQRNFNYILG